MGCESGEMPFTWENVIPPWQQMVAGPLGEFTQRQMGQLATPLPSDMPISAPISSPYMAAGNILMNEYLGMPMGGGLGGYGGGMGGYGGRGGYGGGAPGQGTKPMPDMSTLYDQMGPVSGQPADPNLVFQQPMPSGPMPMPGMGYNPYMGMGNPYSPYFMPPNMGPPFQY